MRFYYRRTENGVPVEPPDIREFTSIQPRLERLGNWERMPNGFEPRDIASEPRRDAPDWSAVPGPGSPTPVPTPATGSGLVLIQSTRRTRRGAPPDTISGTDLDQK